MLLAVYIYILDMENFILLTKLLLYALIFRQVEASKFCQSFRNALPYSKAKEFTDRYHTFSSTLPTLLIQLLIKHQLNSVSRKRPNNTIKLLTTIQLPTTVVVELKHIVCHSRRYHEWVVTRWDTISLRSW